MCINDVCIPLWMLVIAVVVGVAVTVLIAAGASNKISYHEGPTTQAPPPAAYTQPEAEEEPTVKVGQKFLYGESKGCACIFAVTEVDEDESEVSGYLLVNLPADAEAQRVDLDRDNEELVVSFKMPDRSITELFFNIEDPDELWGYEIYIDYVSAQPATI